jgi:hypothetical protein
MLRGSFSRISTRCGRANCWCAHSPKGHPHTRLTWSQNGQLTTRKVPADQKERVLEWTHNYRQFRARRRKLRALHRQIQNLLDQYEQALLAQTRKPLSFLASSSKMSAHHQPNQQKR